VTRFEEHARFASKTITSDGCILWIGKCPQDGNAKVKWNRKTQRVQRVSWIFAHGSVPVGFDVTRTCINRMCVRIEHLVLQSSAGIHGDSVASNGKETPEYTCWLNMKNRCKNETHPEFRIYGGRGISVAERWTVSYLNFLNDMGRRPSARHSIDRIDVNGNYEPGNCRWATTRQQANNTRRTRRFDIDGETLTIRELSERFGVSYFVIRSRILNYGWTAKDAITLPVGRPGQRRVA